MEGVEPGLSTAGCLAVLSALVPFCRAQAVLGRCGPKSPHWASGEAQDAKLLGRRVGRSRPGSRSRSLQPVLTQAAFHLTARLRVGGSTREQVPNPPGLRWQWSDTGYLPLPGCVLWASNITSLSLSSLLSPTGRAYVGGSAHAVIPGSFGDRCLTLPCSAFQI